MGLDSMLETKFCKTKSAKPSTVVAIAQDQDGNLQSNNTDECFIDCSTKLEFVGMPLFFVERHKGPHILEQEEPRLKVISK